MLLFNVMIQIEVNNFTRDLNKKGNNNKKK